MHLRIFLLQESSIKVPTIFSHIELCFQSKPLRTILSRDKLRKHSQPQDRSIYQMHCKSISLQTPLVGIAPTP